MTFRNTLSSKASRLESLFNRPSRHLPSGRQVSEESIVRYCKAGYHPVRIGDLFDDKYRVVSKLGYGVYSTVWLAFDQKLKQHVALKILTADSFGQGHDTFELDIFKHLRRHTSKPGANKTLPLLDEFRHSGPNGEHVCLVFKAMGPDMAKYRRLFPKLQVIHTDIKSSNILIETSEINAMFRDAPSEAFRSDAPPLAPPQDFCMESVQVSSATEDITRATDLSIRLADFGTASWTDKHLTEWIQPQMLRAPEVILGEEWNHKVDVWNLGLIVSLLPIPPESFSMLRSAWLDLELAEGQLLFDGAWTARGEYTPEAHLAQITALLGNMPKRLLDRSKNRDKYFDADGNLLQRSTFPPCSLERFSKNAHPSGEEKEEFLAFVGSMVRADPEDRPDSSTLLESPWLAH